MRHAPRMPGWIVAHIATRSGIMLRMNADEIRRRLADAGVGLFDPAPRAAAPGCEEYAALVEALVRSDDPRFVAAVACLVALHDRGAGASVEAAWSRLDAARRDRLALVYRLARALAVARDPDLVHVLGRSRVLPALALEPADLPDPGDDWGERCLSIAREIHDADPEGNLVIDVTDLFTTWLRQAETDRLDVAHA